MDEKRCDTVEYGAQTPSLWEGRAVTVGDMLGEGRACLSINHALELHEFFKKVNPDCNALSGSPSPATCCLKRQHVAGPPRGRVSKVHGVFRSYGIRSILRHAFRLVRNRPLVFKCFFVFMICLTSLMSAHRGVAQEAPVQQERKVIVIVGAEGATEYGQQFRKWADGLEETIGSSREENPNLKLVRIGGETAASDQADQTDLQILQNEIKASTESTQELWLILIGHGTDDGKNSKFNLRGPDLTAKQLNEWLTPLPCRCVIVNCASASGAFINKLKSENRIVVTATKSSSQYNFARFGEHFLQAIGDPTFDLDKDQQTSLLEAFVAGAKRTEDFYAQEARLATELAVIDDNGDGLGTPANWFEGTRVIRKSKKGEPDGLAANQMILIRRGAESKLTDEQRRLRDALETKIETLRLKKDQMDENVYYGELESVLLELSRIYQASKPETGKLDF